MKSSVLLLSLLALVISGCARTVVKKESKETVRGQPVVTEREIIIQEPVPALRACTYAATTYSHGSLSCQGGYQYLCNDGAWDGRNLPC